LTPQRKNEPGPFIKLGGRVIKLAEVKKIARVHEIEAP